MRNIKLLLVCFSITLSQYAQNKAFENYLSQNNCLINTKNKQTFDCIDTLELNNSLNQFRFFFTGETHYQKGDLQLKISLLKYLNQNQNVRIILLECGYGESFILNEYLENGDESLYFWFDDYEISFYRELRAFNLQLPIHQKIKLAGIDYEKSLLTTNASLIVFSQKYLSNLKDSSLNFEINLFLDNNHIKDSPDKNKIKEFVLFLKHNKTILESVLSKEKYFDLKNIINSHDNYWMGDVNFNKEKPDSSIYLEREKLMFTNTILLSNTYPNANFFGQFGLAHIPLEFQSKWVNKTNITTYCSMLNVKHPFEVCTIPILYGNRKILGFIKIRFDRWNKDKALSKNELITFNKLSKNDSFTLFNLTGKGSPYEEYSKKIGQFIIVNKIK